jgi:ubiquitin carboxyl-terminal hydrolase 9/13
VSPMNTTSMTGKHKKELEPEPEITPLQKMLMKETGPIKADGSDKFFGLENVSCTPHQLSAPF